MQNFAEVAQWLATGGSVIVASWFAAWLLEDFAWWQAVRPQVKKLLILLVSLGIGAGAQYLRLHEPALAALRPYLDSAILILVAWIATQVAHQSDPSRASRSGSSSTQRGKP
jgi:hypothetical protein